MPSSEGSIVLVHRDRKTQRVIQRVLGSTLRAVHVADGPDELRGLLRDHVPELIVASAALYLDGALDEVVAEACARGAVGCIVLADEPHQDAARLIEHADVEHVVASPMPGLAEELTIAAQKLLRRDFFGCEKYLAWGTVLLDTEVTSTTDRHRAVNELVGTVETMGLAARTHAQAMLIADELVSNATHNAPVDDRGDHYLRDVGREVHRELVGRERPRLRWGCDSRYLAIEVTDQYGTIDPTTVRRHLAKASARTMAIRTDTAGAGLGLAMTYASSSQLVFNVEPGYRTQVIALVDVRGRAPTGTAPVPSFHLFYTGGDRA